MRVWLTDMLCTILAAIAVWAPLMWLAHRHTSPEASISGPRGARYFIGWHGGHLHLARQWVSQAASNEFRIDLTKWCGLTVHNANSRMSTWSDQWQLDQYFLGVRWRSTQLSIVATSIGNKAGKAGPLFVMQHRSVGLPWWMLSLASAPLPLVWLRIRTLPRRRRAAGLCGACGYDLRSSPDRCPECGTPSNPTAHSKAVSSSPCPSSPAPVRSLSTL